LRPSPSLPPDAGACARRRGAGRLGDRRRGLRQQPRAAGELEARRVGYVLAVARDHHVRFGGTSHRADELLSRVPARAWQTISAGPGAKGQRCCAWAFLGLDHDGPAPIGQAGQRWRMIGRNRTTGELVFYRCSTPRPTPLAVLVNVAGRRWTIEESFQTGKGLCGLDQHQVRRWRSWYRWATLALLAHPSWSSLPWPNALATRHNPS
jgi:hypothetical protein